MQGKRKLVPAQRGPKGDLIFWMPYRRGYVVVNYQSAMLEMAKKYGRIDLKEPDEEASL